MERRKTIHIDDDLINRLRERSLKRRGQVSLLEEDDRSDGLI